MFFLSRMLTDIVALVFFTSNNFLKYIFNIFFIHKCRYIYQNRLKLFFLFYRLTNTLLLENVLQLLKFLSFLQSLFKQSLFLSFFFMVAIKHQLAVRRSIFFCDWSKKLDKKQFSLGKNKKTINFVSFSRCFVYIVFNFKWPSFFLSIPFYTLIVCKLPIIISDNIIQF